MADPRFFDKAEPLKIGQLAEMTQSRLSGSDPELLLYDVAPLDRAGPEDLGFLDNIRYRNDFISTRAGACFVTPELAHLAPEGVALLITETPYKSYAHAAQKLYPEYWPEANISPSAHLAASVTLGKGSVIEPGVVIGENVELGDYCWIEANTVIGCNVKIGSYCRIGANATVSHSIIGDHVRLYTGVRAGQDGFGFAIDPAGFVKVPQLGRVIIEDGVEIGANTTIDRGAGPDTIIGQGSWIDNLVQIAHNVRVGKACVIVSQVGISGSTVLEDYVVLAGQVGVAGHLRIGQGARIAAQSGIMRNVPSGEEQMGSPAVPIKQNMRQIVAVKRLLKKTT